MKRFERIFRYISDYKTKLIYYVIYTLLGTFFGIFSLAMLSPFVSLLVAGSGPSQAVIKSNAAGGAISDFLNNIVVEHGKIWALAAICVFIIIATALKNLFIYLSNLISAPIRSAIATRFRNDLYEKILVLPVGYFTEKRKGDIMSRMTNDVAEIENSIVSTLEGLIKDPLTILGYIIFMVYTSVQMVLTLLICWRINHKEEGD